MSEFLRNLLTADFMPHGHCYLWRPEIVWLHVLSDALIALAYYSIPVALFYFARRRKDLAFRPIFWMFGAFILACGTTHVMEVVTLWQPVYRLSGLIKLATALLSVATAVVLWPLIPRALELPSPAQLAEANRELKLVIEQRTRAEEELRRLNAALEERVRARMAEVERSNEDLQQFAYVASHDLQEPLRMVASFTELLARRYRGRLDADADTFIGHAVDGARRMQRMIDDLLSYSRLDGRSDTLRSVDTNDVVEQALDNLSMAIEESGATVTREGLPEIVGDATQLVQLFQNLVGNAIKYRGEAPPRIEIAAAPGPEGWLFSVKDNGIGLDPKYAEQVFVIFKRLHGAAYPGTGIGLALCRRIVRRHGGRIWVESRPGEGAVFRFMLPEPRARA